MVAMLGEVVVLATSATAKDPLYLAPFRESQTAISAAYLLCESGDGPLAYQLPVLGAPWCLPHEFPVFQQLAA